MHPYLEHTLYATKTLIKAIFNEEDELARLTAMRKDKERQLPGLREGVEFLVMNPDLDDEGLGQLMAAEHWETSNDIRQLSSDIAQLTQAIANKEDATTALCGALLQIAKRGITGPNGKMDVSKSGRPIDGLPLEEIIWAARNQTMHPEYPPDNTLGQHVFSTLKKEHGPSFDAAAGRDLAREVIDLLGWKNLAKYTADMESILP
jgi:hypothetical protein